ncbi:MAG: porin [Xylophilus ampelinus]
MIHPFRVVAGLCVAATGAAACQPASAQQQGGPAGTVSIYGVLDAYAGSLRRSDQAGRISAVNSGGLTTSYFGVRGNEDLGGGARAFFVLESFFQGDTGVQGRTAADPFFSRNSYVGLGNSLGALTLGRQTNPMFVATGNFNPFGLSANLAPAMLHVWSAGYNRTVLGDSVWDNAVQYSTPSIGGLTGAATYGFGERSGNAGVRNANLTLNYANGPLAAVASAQQVKYGPGVVAPIGSEKAAMAGLSYDFRIAKLFGQHFRTETPDTALKTRTSQVGASAPLAGGTLMASVARTERDAPTADARRTTTGLGYNRFLSKRTDAYTVYLSDRLTGSPRRGSLAIGVRHRF